MEGDDPYRSGTMMATCPRCSGDLVNDGEMRLSCLGGCGAWCPREHMEHVVTWAEVVKALEQRVATSWPWGTATCPSCRKAMTVAFHEELRFDRCDLHGVWLDTGEYDRFVELFRKR